MISRLPRVPCPNMQTIDVSDSHSVASQPVWPALDLPVYGTSPMLAPCTVTDDDPVLALFVGRAMLITPTSFEYISDCVPPLAPAVIVIRRDPCIPALIRARVLESESHSVISHLVPPPLGIAVLSVIPIFDPVRVTTAEPVANLFGINIPLTLAELYENPEVALESCAADVSTITL